MSDQVATALKVTVLNSGPHLLITQHGPEEFDMVLTTAGVKVKPIFEREHGHHHHHHDESVTSVGIEETREMDARKINAWLSELLQTKGQDIFRMKGILHIKGQANRFVFQGVHMLFEGKPDRPWHATETRKSQIVFIGRNLDRAALNAGFRRCVV